MNWIPAFSTAGLVALVLWLARNLILTRLTKSVQHEFDNKLEELRANLRKSEETFKADLRSKESQIEVLRSGALAGLVSRQAALDKRRIEAVDQLWSSMTALASVKTAPATLASLNYEYAAEEAAKDPRLREVFAKVVAPFDINKMNLGDAAKARPFVSPLAWALFSAYQAILIFAVFRLNMLKVGLNIPKAVDSEAVIKLVKAALPHRIDYITEYGVKGFHHLIDELEDHLLEEMKRMLKGEESDKATVKQAAGILKEAEQVMGSVFQPAPPLTSLPASPPAPPPAP